MDLPHRALSPYAPVLVAVALFDTGCLVKNDEFDDTRPIVESGGGSEETSDSGTWAATESDDGSGETAGFDGGEITGEGSGEATGGGTTGEPGGDHGHGGTEGGAGETGGAGGSDGTSAGQASGGPQDTETSTGGAAPSEELMALDCARERNERTRVQNKETSIHWVNESGGTRRTHWLDPSGTRVHVADLQPGDQADQPTFLTNPWVITDESDACTAMFLPTSKPAQAVLR